MPKSDFYLKNKSKFGSCNFPQKKMLQFRVHVVCTCNKKRLPGMCLFVSCNPSMKWKWAKKEI